ncbi:BrnT family toxin [Marinospirillum insulare]|uniref:Membrane protein n=1 Tax=Marinospirillum insulare TaxID=217169 RepID=A0ABQ5ZWG7_9GAMM|nr:BrnT family toxin [Marinospirillum insulare]GLR63403.1 membrane protein [Marinospirillum insulare]
MKFEWDEQKNKKNIEKHHVSFKQAVEVFNDPLHLAMLDYRYSYFEERWITLGNTMNQKLLVVANLYFTDKGEEVIRIISARKATALERKQYEKS